MANGTTPIPIYDFSLDEEQIAARLGFLACRGRAVYRSWMCYVLQEDGASTPQT